MTFRERLLTALDGGRTDVMPWFADLTYWYGARQRDGLIPPEYEGDEGFVRLHADYHVGYYLGYASAASIRYDGVETSSSQDGNITTTRWSTPVGEIIAEYTYLPATYSSAPTRWPVRTPDDLRVLTYIAEATVVTPAPERLETLKAIAGDQGHPTVLPTRSPVSQMLAQWSGVENFAYLEADVPEQLRATLDALGRAADPVYEAAAALDTPFVELPDNLAGDVMAGWFRRYQFDYYVMRAEQLHAAGKKMGAHLDGAVRPLLGLLVEAGLDFVEALTPQPTGDVGIAELRELGGPDVVLFGGVPGAMFAPPFVADDIKRHVETVIETHWDHGRFILGVADQVPPDGDIELVRLIGEICEQST